jgi:hypothetical protein
MKWLAPLLALAGLALPALGCLGDAEGELTQRYGPQVKTGTSAIPGVTVRGYFYKGFLVVVGILNGRSAYEMYAKKDNSKISSNEVAALMTANSNGKTWTVDDSAASGAAKWVLDDGSVIAQWEKASGGPLTVMTKEAADLEKSSPPKK